MDLLSERLRLRETDWHDLPVVHALLNEPEVLRHSAISMPGSVEWTRAFMAQAIEDRNQVPRRHYEWLMLDRSRDDARGLIGLSLMATGFHCGELHFHLFPEFWNQGYASEAIQSVIAFGFEYLVLNRIGASVAATNVRSQKLLLRLGMTLEGKLREALPIHGEWQDQWLYGILQREF